MATRFRRAKANAKVCKICHREKGDRKKPKCPLCPGQAIADTLLEHAIRGVRLVVVDPSLERTGVVVTSPTDPGALELRASFDPLGPELDGIMRAALSRSERDGAPTWLVLEDPGVGGPRANPAMFLAVGQAMGMARRAWARAGGSDRRVVLVLQVSWQAGTGVARGTKDDRGARLDEAVARAEEVWTSRSLEGDWDGDQACAAMLAHFCLRWPEFTERMSERDRGAAEACADALPGMAVVPPQSSQDAPEGPARPVPSSTVPRATTGSLFG